MLFQLDQSNRIYYIPLFFHLQLILIQLNIVYIENARAVANESKPSTSETCVPAIKRAAE